MQYKHFYIVLIHENTHLSSLEFYDNFHTFKKTEIIK
jgi:hypothetical protein